MEQMTTRFIRSGNIASLAYLISLVGWCRWLVGGGGHSHGKEGYVDFLLVGRHHHDSEEGSGRIVAFYLP